MRPWVCVRPSRARPRPSPAPRSPGTRARCASRRSCPWPRGSARAARAAMPTRSPSGRSSSTSCHLSWVCPRRPFWSYGSVHHPETFAYPAFTIEATYRRPRAREVDQRAQGPSDRPLPPHLLPVDPTLHWANPPGGAQGRDSRPAFPGDCPPGPYRGPVPIVTHLHGMARMGQESDGYPEAWYLPAGTDIPEGVRGDRHLLRLLPAHRPRSGTCGAGRGGFQYPNDQRATTLVVPRPHARHHPAQPLRGAGRLLPAPRRAGRSAAGRPARTSPATGRPPRSEGVRDPALDPGPLLQRRRVALHPASRGLAPSSRTCTSRRAISRRSGSRSSSATSSSSTDGRGPISRSSSGGTASAS